MANAGGGGTADRRCSHRLNAIATALACRTAKVAATLDSGDPPLGSLEGPLPPLRSFSVAELLPPGSQHAVSSSELPEFPAALPDDHPAVAQFRTLGYVAIPDALTGAALGRVVETFCRGQPRAEAVWRTVTRDQSQRAFLAGDSEQTVQQYFDLPREDVMDDIEAWNSGAWGGFLVTQLADDFDAYMLALNNALVMPLLLALVGPALHLMEAGARTVLPQPPEFVQKHGPYTTWHRDYGNEGLRRPIGPVSDYCRCKCFLMLSDTEDEGGPLGLVPGSHLWRAGTPPPKYLDGIDMVSLPGHVKCAVPAGGMILFE
eukprot:COSAG02_NODE_8483_length_2553_cov_3.136919_2_plen_317_part_00